MFKIAIVKTLLLGSCALMLAGETLWSAEVEPTKKEAKNRKIQQATGDFFQRADVPVIQIEIPKEALESLRKYVWQFGPQTSREWVHVTVREEQTTYPDVALHLKGAAGSFRPVDDNPALTLHFNKYVAGQRFHGLEKLSLNNSVQDPTFVSEQLCRELFLKAGVPVPRVTHAQVELNGRNLGLYVLAEGWDKQFLKQHFKSVKGNLYDGGFLKDINDELVANVGDAKDQSDRVALLEAAKEPNLTNRVARLEKTLDINRFLTFLALEVMVWDWDGYPMNRNNWRLYHDTDQDKMVFMPHGMDQMFWKPEGPLLPAMQGLVAKAVLEVPAYRERYFTRIKELRWTVFDVPAMTNHVLEIARKIRPVLAKKHADAGAEHERVVAQFCESIAARGRSIDDQLEHPIEPLQFDGNGIARLGGWLAKSEFGHPLLTREITEGIQESLALGTVQGSSIGSWRTKVWLEPGRYRVEGRLKTDGIVGDPGDPRAGVGFRLGNGRPQKYAVGTSDWRVIDYEFSIKETLAETQIVCDFRGAAGRAWFDLDSLRLKRLER